MMDLIIRPATKNDSSRIHWLVYRAGINPFGLKWQRFVIAETNDGQFLGCAQLKPHGDGSIELASLAVKRPYRGRGVARVIIEHLLASSPRPLFLMCRAELCRFYAKFGFQPVGSETLPPHFRRLRKLFNMVSVLARREQGLIMRLG